MRNTALEQRSLFRVSRMKLGIYLRERCRIYFVAAEHELAFAMPLHRSHTMIGNLSWRRLGVAERGSWNDWLEYFLLGVARISEDALNRATRINELLAKWQKK